MKNKNINLKNWSGTLSVMGIDWGDSGKGRLIDDLASRADIVARYNGGANTGHTVENNLGKFAFHIIPSGILHKKAKNLIGRNVVVDLESLNSELENLKKSKFTVKNLIIDSQATLVMPWHKMRDGIREKLRSSKKVGTTGMGVGPAYADRIERVGLRVCDLLLPDFKNKLSQEVEIQNRFYNLNLNNKKILSQYLQYAKTIKAFVGNTVQIVKDAKNENKNILFEGAQGYFLDVDSGTYPYVTSSSTGIVGIHRSYDLHPSNIDMVIGITKAYTTRVGGGPMPTKMAKKESEYIVEKGHEVGTTTGRIRSPGWLDLVLINFAKESNNLTALAVTKLDVLSGLKKIKLCIKYKLGTKTVEYFPNNATFQESLSPIYIEMTGWNEDISAVRNFKDLPNNAKLYLSAIEKYTQLPIKFISVGPKRGQVIYV